MPARIHSGKVFTPGRTRMLAAGMALGTFGCAALPPNSFLDPTAIGQFPSEYKESEIRRVLTARDTPLGPANATEPTASDLEPAFEEYRIGPGDTVLVQVPDLLATGQIYQAQQDVNEKGELRIPALGTVRVLGLSEAEAEEALRVALRDSGLLPDGITQVQMLNRRGRVYSIIGSVAAAGPYPIPQPDFRLLDAIAFARDIGAEVRKLYVIRRVDGAATPAQPMARGKKAARPNLDDWEFEDRGDDPFADESPLFSTASALQDPPRRDPIDDDLSSILNEDFSDAETDDGGFEPLRFNREGELNGGSARPGRRATPARPESPVADGEPFDWDDVPELDNTQRVIEIDVMALKQGDPRYNIVIRDRDVIQVPVDNGIFYMMGQINRPGVFPFGGREITVKQAIALAGGFAALAWPSRCEIIRREPGTDKQLTIPIDVDAVFAGRSPDVLLRPDDIFNAGTHVAAPFLFVLRNSFRFTYGFGFVYDRNFADKDAYFAQTNPSALAQQRQAQRGLPF